MPIEAVREPVGKTVIQNSGTNQNVLNYMNYTRDLETVAKGVIVFAGCP